MVVDVHLMIVAHRLFLIKAYRICNILSTTFSYYLSIISTKAGTPCFHSVPAFFVFTGSVSLLHQSAYSLVTPHRFVRLLFGKTSQNWCSCGVALQISPEFRLKIHRICVFIFAFYCSIGFIVGNSSTSRIEALSVSSITRRSTPKPRPPVGGRPYSSALT